MSRDQVDTAPDAAAGGGFAASGRTAGWLAAAAVLLAGCGDASLLEVEDPDVVSPGALEGPDGVQVRINGVVGDFQEAVDDHVLYSALFTDEMILAGTFPSRIDVDERIVREDPDNATLTEELYEPLHVSRASADEAVRQFRDVLGDPEFSEVEGLVREGIARALYIGAHDRLLLAELYCQSIVPGESAPVGPDARMRDALSRFRAADSAATDAGLPDVATAAQVGRARALAWLGRFGEAAGVASEVPDGFAFLSRYSSNTDEQWNEMFGFTHGAGNFNVRWTVGDGTSGNRHDERWPYFDEWVSQGLLDPETDLQAAEIGVPVVLQLLYDRRDSDIVVASGWEARMIEAEAELRTGDPEAAEDDVNALLEDAAQSSNPLRAANPDLELGAFDPVDFTGDLASDLERMARARAAGLWLSGTRQGYLRRIAERDGVDLYPSGTQGDDRSFPVVQQEIDNNDAVRSACP